MHAVVRTLNGTVSAEVDVGPDSTIADLKELCGKDWRFPPIFQRLCIGDNVPQDSVLLKDLLREGESELVVTLLLSLSCLEDSDDQIRYDALEALAVLTAQEGNKASTERALTAIIACLQDPEAPTRRLAIRILGDLADPSDAQVVPLACAALKDSEPQVVCTALEVLAKFAEPGNEQAMVAIIACLDNAPHLHGEDVSFAAVRTLGSLAKKGETRCMQALCGVLEDGNGYLRLLALDVLSVTAAKGDAVAIPAVRARLKDRDGNIRAKALEALVSIAETGDEEVIAGITECLQDKSERFRTSALIALSKVAPKGHKATIDAMCMCVADESLDVRCIALEVLVNVAEKGDAAAIAAARSRLDPEDNSDVVEAAKELLKSIGEGA